MTTCKAAIVSSFFLPVNTLRRRGAITAALSQAAANTSVELDQGAFMPYKPSRPCASPGCPNLTTNTPRYCDVHLKQTQQAADRQRGTAAQRGYDGRWHKARTAYLSEHPLCVLCQQEGRVTAATLVDHIIPHRGDYSLMWDENNWQSLCTPHHSIKTATQDGAFGNKETR